jgi:hypothetical protein
MADPHQERTTMKASLRIAAAFAAFAVAVPAYAQTSFKIAEKEVQVHGSFQQGFVLSKGNNFLTMDTNDGTGEMTDGAVNLSTNITRKLRVGGQLYLRNIGQLGNGHPQLDWAFADYKFNQAFGIRAGKVKTALGLFNDTQDMEFLHTWALLPQGVYPLDLRSVTIAHVGADAYGTISLKKAGSLQYTVYGGSIQDDLHGGYRYGVEDQGMVIRDEMTNRGGGADLRWNAPVDGLAVGYSIIRTAVEGDLGMPAFGPMTIHLELPKWQQQAVFGDYQRDRVRVSAEYRQYVTEVKLTPAIAPEDMTKGQGWFVSGSYRISKYLEVGSYRSQYVGNTALSTSADDNHINDTALTGRIDLNSFWSVKVEGHFMDGYGDPFSARGFYLRSNPAGLEPNTKMLVVRTGVNF